MYQIQLNENVVCADCKRKQILELIIMIRIIFDDKIRYYTGSW